MAVGIIKNLYDTDFALWAEHTAELIRSGRFEAVDLEHVAEEIEDMGRRDLRELSSRLERTLEHALKLRLVGGVDHARNERGWRASMARQQSNIQGLLAQSPSLRRRIPELMAGAYSAAARVVTIEYDVTAPAECPWTAEELL